MPHFVDSNIIFFTIFSADIKRQEHIYEFILTESNHCQVLKVIQKIFVEGMFKYLSLSKDIVDRIFPQIDTLIDLHFRFLEELRARQNQVSCQKLLKSVKFMPKWHKKL